MDSELKLTSELEKILVRLPPDEQQIWLEEAVRLSEIITRYQKIKRKRYFNREMRKYAFVPEVNKLCKEAMSSNPTIVIRESRRARPISPHTLDKWSKDFTQFGLQIFIRAAYKQPDSNTDMRYVRMSVGAIKWINENWRKFKGARALFNKLTELAQKENWLIPSESWLYRRWKNMPQIVAVHHLQGRDAYQSKLAPYVPRDLSDLEALQVLCGDHREADVTVHIGSGKLARVWLTYWLDLRTSLIWGWYLSLTPTAEAISLAYADGIAKFGAQPFSRPESGFYSYIYTDRGKSYRSHDIEGKVIKIHERAADITGNFSYFLIERNIGLIEEFKIKQLLAKARNPKEKQIERTNRDFSEWEKNEFKEYCGNKPSERPDAWYKLFEKHKRLSKTKNFKSPFIEFDEYKTKLSERIDKHNSSVHERSNLGGASIIPIEEFKILYKTRYEIPQNLAVILLLKTTARTIGKIGINCFNKSWHYWNDLMSGLKGLKVEVRYTDSDYKKVWVVLPGKGLCEAKRVEPVSLLNPNKEVMKQIKRMEANENQIIRNFQLIQQSRLRGETVEDRLAEYSHDEIDQINSDSSNQLPKSSIYLFPRIIKNKRDMSNPAKIVSAEDVAGTESKDDIFVMRKIIKINEFD
ncbi:MAG: Mu transposase C-terminal domain-containing protein [Pyrinomonadaceae bacterium]